MLDREEAFSAHLVVKIHFPSCIKNLKMGWPELRAGCSSARQGRDNFTRIKLLAVNCESWVQWNQCGHPGPSTGILDTGSSQLHWRFSNDTVCPPLYATCIIASNFADFRRYICLHWSPNSTYHLYFVEYNHANAMCPSVEMPLCSWSMHHCTSCSSEVGVKIMMSKWLIESRQQVAAWHFMGIYLISETLSF